MTPIKNRDDLRTMARRNGMADAAVGDVHAGRNGSTMRYRVGANVMRDIGIAEERIAEKYGYNPEPLDENHVPSAVRPFRVDDGIQPSLSDRRLDRSEYRDFSSDVDVGSGVRPARNSVEDRTNAEVMRRDGVSDAEIERRFGYLPEPVGDGPRRHLRNRSPRSSQGDGNAGIERRRFMEPG